MTEITLKFVCGGDESEAIAIATSISDYLGGAPVAILRPDGTKNVVVALPTAQYDMATGEPVPGRNTDGNDPTPLRRGPPAHADDDMPPQSVYSDFGY